MVAAQRQQVIDRRGLLLDQPDGVGDVAERDREIADVRQRQRGRIDAPVGMVAVGEHAARLADGPRPEAGAGTVGGAEIEGDAGDAEFGVAVVTADAEEGRRHGEGRGIGHGGHVKRKTAAAMAQVQRPDLSPSEAAVSDVLPMMSWLVS